VADDCGKVLPVESAVLLPESTGVAEAGGVPPAEAERVGATEAGREATLEVLANSVDDGGGVALAASEEVPLAEVGLGAACEKVPVGRAVGVLTDFGGGLADEGVPLADATSDSVPLDAAVCKSAAAAEAEAEA
jgi:hypothetical protein